MEEKEVEKEIAQPEEMTEDMDLDIISKAEAAADRIEKSVAAMQGEVRKLQKLKMESILGGKAETNLPPPVETPKEYAEKVMANEKETK